MTKWMGATEARKRQKPITERGNIDGKLTYASTTDLKLLFQELSYHASGKEITSSINVVINSWRYITYTTKKNIVNLSCINLSVPYTSPNSL